MGILSKWVVCSFHYIRCTSRRRRAVLAQLACLWLAHAFDWAEIGLNEELRGVSVALRRRRVRFAQFANQLVSYDISAAPQKALMSRSEILPMDKTLGSERPGLPPSVCTQRCAHYLSAAGTPPTSTATLCGSRLTRPQRPEEPQVAMLNRLLFFQSDGGWAPASAPLRTLWN